MNDVSKTNEFLQLLMANHKRIYAFILGMVPNYQDAEDLFQETILVMWSKFDQFARGTSFTSWGVTVAKYQILNARRRKSIRSLPFSPDVEDLIQERSSSLVGHIDARMQALRECIRKLQTRDYELVQMRYERELDVQTIADRLGRSAQSVYKKLARINDALLRCIRKTLVQEEVA
jgi:RNA polymerase sigma-70 factor (ECF subfamily)